MSFIVEFMQDKIYCVECGKEKIFKNGVCLDCYLKNTKFTQGPEVIDIITCPSCSSYKYKNTWFSESFEKILKRHIKDVFNISKDLKDISIDTSFGKKDKFLLGNISISGFIDGQKVTEEHTLNVRLKKTICDVCSKQFGGYYEAVIQIRADKRNLSDDELKKVSDIVISFVEDMRDKGNRGLFITDFSKEHGGLDFYLSEKGLAYTIVKKIQDLYGGEIKQSSTNVGMKDSRQVYRMTYLIRIPAFKSGDFIYYDNNFYYIKDINKNKVHVLKLKNWERYIFDLKEIQKAKIFGGSELILEMIIVSQSKDEIQIMDSKNYKIFELKKPKIVTFKNKIVNLIKLDDNYFLLPDNNFEKKTQ